jgi:hypothetical protein
VPRSVDANGIKKPLFFFDRIILKLEEREGKNGRRPSALQPEGV